MVKHKKWITMIAIAGISIGWFARYQTFNLEIQEKYDVKEEYYQKGDMVDFGDNYLGKDKMEGYSIRVNQSRILDCEKYLEEKGTSIEKMNLELPPEKICEVSITISNARSKEKGISLTSLMLHGIDFYTDWNSQLLVLANPVLGDSLGIALKPNSTYDMTLIYNLRKMHFPEHRWDRLEDEKFKILLTHYPVRKEIEFNIPCTEE